MILGVGFEVSNDLYQFSLSLVCGSDVSSQMLIQSHTCLPDAGITTMMVMDSTSETVNAK